MSNETSRSWTRRINTVLNGDKYKRYLNRADGAYKSYFTSHGNVEGDVKEIISENNFWKYSKDLTASIYTKPPKIKVFRTFKDNDPVGRVASFLLQRNMKEVLESSRDFHDTLKLVIRDRVVAGAGFMMWKYVKDEDRVVPVHLKYDRVVFPISPCWNETPWIAVRHDVPFDERVKRWGKAKALKSGDSSQYTGSDSRIEMSIREKESLGNYPKIYQVFDKLNTKVIWVCLDSEEILDESDYTLEIGDFYPIPKPFMADLDSESSYPVPEYYYFQDLLQKLSDTDRAINDLISIAKLNYLYDARFGDMLEKLFDGDCGVGYSVQDWQGLAEPTDITKGIVFTPLEKIVSSIQGLQSIRADLLQRLRTVTGGIVGGLGQGQYESAASIKSKEATVTAQQVQFKTDFIMYVKDVLNVGADLLAETYSDKDLLERSTALFGLSQDDYGIIEPALKLLRKEKTRSFRLTIYPESMAQEDDAAKRKDSMEMLNVLGQVVRMGKEVAATNPQVVPSLVELSLYVIRQFNNTDQVEHSVEQLLQGALQAPPPQPSSDVQMVQMQTQAQQQSKMIDAQLEQQKQALEREIKTKELMLKQQEMQLNAMKEAGKLMVDQMKHERGDDA
jgi:hypothetical protein